MDYIYRLLSRELAKKRSDSMDYAIAQERIYLYLTKIIASEIWWLLRCRNQNKLAENICNAKNAGDTLSQLNNAARSAISDLNRLNAYENLLQKLDEIRRGRNGISHNDGLRLLDAQELKLVAEDQQTLEEIADLLTSDLYPISRSSAWTPIIPVGRRGNQLICKCYRTWSNKLTGDTEYGWTEELLDPEFEFQRDGIRSSTHMKEGRLYFYKKAPVNVFGAPPEVSCAYPFIQVDWDEDRNDLNRIWFFDSVETWTNGYCKGTDILAPDRCGQIDRAHIPELAVDNRDSNNIYLMKSEVDKYKRAYPIRNVYHANYQKWMDNVSASESIAKIKKHLQNNARVVNLFGTGGIGKTATIHHMLEEEYYRTGSKGPLYDYIIFLSAKQREWNKHCMTEVAYVDGRQSFQDLSTLRRCLNNIFGDSAELPADQKQDETWYDGKSILMILDDLESVDAAKWPAIMDYLEQHFTATEGKKKRQVIITRRNMPTEGYTANVRQAAMNESDSADFAIFCADIMGEGRGKAYRLALGEGNDESMLNAKQRENRALLIRATSGLPLIIRVLVFSNKDAVLTRDMRTSRELLEYLYKETYRYLSSDEQRKLAFIAAILTSEEESCAMDRLQFVWNYEEQSGNCDIANMVQNLCDYGVLSTVEEGKVQSFSFPIENMRQYIEQGFVSDPKRQQILPEKSEQLAYWLREHHRCSIEQCLMRHLQDTVQEWYRQQNPNNYDIQAGNQDEYTLLKNMAQLYRAIHKKVGEGSYLFRAAMQMLVQVCRDGSRATEQLLKAIENISPPYYTEFIRGQLKLILNVSTGESHYKKVQKIQKMLVDHLMNISQNSGGDNRNTLLILWSTMLLIQDIKNAGGVIIPELPIVLDNACQGCASRFDKISDTDRQAFIAQMEKTIALFDNPSQKQKSAINSMKNRCIDMKVSFAEPSSKNSENIFFLSPL